MKKTMPRKPAKKSPAPKAGRMKAWVGYCDIGEDDGKPFPMVFGNKQWLLNHRGTEGWQAIRVLVTELHSTPSPDRRVEEIRRWCENAIAYDRLTNAGTLVFARDILKICNSKGPR